MMDWNYDRLFQPEALWICGAVALVLFALEWRARPAGRIRLSTGSRLARLARGQEQWPRRLPAALRLLGLMLWAVALAEPVWAMRPVMNRAEAADIMLCVDLSGSMQALDFKIAGKPASRIDVTKQAVREFIERRRQAGVRRGSQRRFGTDRLGLIAYAGYAWTQTPLTFDYAILERGLEEAAIDEHDPKRRGTAIGSALGLAVSKLLDSESASKVIVLLTDGRNNKGALEPVTAAHIAKDYGIRIYTIGAGTGGVVQVPRTLRDGKTQIIQAHIPLDEGMLRELAEVTDGEFFRATDVAGLEEAYAEIDRLERTLIEMPVAYEYEPAFVPWALGGAVVLGASVFIRRRWYEPIP